MRALALYALLAVPSAALVQTGWGRGAAIAYLVAFGALLLALWVAEPRIGPVVARRAPLWLGGFFVALAVGLVVAYPLLDRGGQRGGSDADEALELGAAALVQGDYPYAKRTYLGNPISPLPGTLVMALPLALNNAVPALGWLWLAALAAYLVRWRGAPYALGTVVLSVALVPAMLYHLATGSDYLANSLSVLLMPLALIGWRAERRGRTVVALLVGVMLASRANFWFVLPPLLAAVSARRGLCYAARDGAWIVAGLAAMVLPFYLADPAQFTPLTTANKLRFLAPELPWLPTVVVVGTALTALLLARRHNNRHRTAFLGHAAAILLLPVVAGILLLSIRLGGWDLRYGNYALFALPWGVLALYRPRGAIR